jgi:hypothetical protein
VPTTPAWSAAVNGLPGDLDATMHAAQTSQGLGTHATVPIYDGSAVVTSGGYSLFEWLTYGEGYDLDQPFVLPGTTIGRVTLPISSIGRGASLLVSLYPDNGSGSPNTSGSPIASTMLPAGYINEVAATDGLDSAPGPLSTAWSNSYLLADSVTTTSWIGPSNTPSGAPGVASAYATSGNFAIFAGGTYGPGSTLVTGVNSVQYLGGGTVSLPVPQPALPVATTNGALSITSGAVVHAGGFTVYGSQASVTSNVWTASWDSVAGTIGSWSSQTALPVAISDASTAVWGDVIYIIGGINAADSTVNTVYWSPVVNGQIGSWSISQLPTAVCDPIVAAVNGWLIVAGGGSTPVAGAATTNVYYAPIASTGEPGAWRTGSPLPMATACNQSPNGSNASTDNAIVIIGGLGTSGSLQNVQTMTVTADGPSNNWVSCNWANPTETALASFPLGASGQWGVFSLYPAAYDSQYQYSVLMPVPLVSVPLYATGLTNGATYHIVLQQGAQPSAHDYLQVGVTNYGQPLNGLYSARHSGTWLALGSSIPLTVYNATASTNGLVRHTWEDPGSGLVQRWSTLTYNNKGLLTGVLESTLQPNSPLNSNPTFTSGVSPWTQGGFPESGLLTPSGSAATVYAQSELVPVLISNPVLAEASWYVVNGWLYSPPGYGHVSLSISWFDWGSNLISTSGNTITLAAATWTQVTNTFLAPPTAAFAAIAVTETGTPASSAVLYLSDVTITQSPETLTAFPSAAQVNYGTPPWPPTGVTQLL